MNTAHTDHDGAAAGRKLSSLKGAHRRTLDAIFQHPTPHSLEWRELVGLIETVGDLHGKSNNEFVFEVAGLRHLMHKPHTKDLTSSEVIDVRHFLAKAGLSPNLASQPSAHPDPAAPSLLVVVDHHGARVYHVDVAGDDESAHVIRPYDPHHFLHHLSHKGQSRERGQRAPEEPAFYEQIAQALALGGKIILVGHGTGKRNAAHHLADFLRSHHRETYDRVVREIVADLSSITTPQLLDLSRQALLS
jgi:hypothetical protein